MNFNNSSSDEEDELIEETTLDKKEWDCFVNDPPDADVDDKEGVFYHFFLKTLKVITYIVTFALVLGGAVIAKTVMLLMVAQLDPDRTLAYCNKNFGNNVQFIAYSSQLDRISWTWALFFVFLAPELQTFLRSARIWFFKGQNTSAFRKQDFFVPFLFETLHTFGLALLVFCVLPTMDSVKAAMLTNCVCIVPALLGMFSRPRDSKWAVKCLVDIFAILFQMVGLFLWPLFAPQKSSDMPYLLPIAVLLVSFRWWENYVDESSPMNFISGLGKIKNRLETFRYSVYTFISIWKMIVFLGSMLFCFYLNEDEAPWKLFSDFVSSFESHTFLIQEKRPPVPSDVEPQINGTIIQPGSMLAENNSSSVLYALLCQVLGAYLCYIIGKFACKILIQGFSFAFPILMTVPTTVVFLLTTCGMRDTDVCYWNNWIPGYISWNCPTGDFWNDFFGTEHAWAWIIWLLSQTWITYHIWTPKGIRLARTEVLFVAPHYNSILIDQSLALNRRRNEVDYSSLEDIDDDESSYGGSEINSVLTNIDKGMEEKLKIHEEDEVPKIYACATMWHENREEMIQMLKSIFRMDADQCARRLARNFFEYVDPGYYEFETHIFFDDAFKLSKSDDPESPKVINDFVRIFLGTLEDAASHVHESFITIRRPKIIPTPYGGRIEWILPGKTQLIVHMKDKDKIRHKKRWSQVMYMYYLLGHRLMDTDIPVARKEVIAENTFLLALDGDIDFQPHAVELLVDLMKKNKVLGAACGRIHPIGSGPMVWYQKFEYAVGHWLQKATEHVIGCVLCSPGCFSLFRAKALMDNNVVARYTTLSSEPRHYVQYDQGEDRWLCTLLLQQGWRVEYSAASDAKTHAPEGFNEFYNQRRRWVPSTMANILDLLLDYKRTIRVNPDISYLYIMYQIGLMIGSILGPGTIFLMLVGAFATAFNLGQWTSFLLNFIPIGIFLVVCYFCKSDVQLTIAQIISGVYALVMVAVVVAIALQVAEDGLLAPSSIFLVIVAASFIISALLHPLEFGCLVHGLLYYITIPSMYLLLIIYSLFNLNNVSWGTREGPVTKSKAQLEAEAKAAAEAKANKKKGFFAGLMPKGKGDKDDRDGSIEFSFAGLFKVMCCLSKEEDSTKIHMARIADQLERVNNRLDMMERSINPPQGSSKTVSFGSRGKLDSIGEENDSVDDNVGSTAPEKIQRNELMNPYWMEDEALNGKQDFLTGREIDYWNSFIEKYLKPLPPDPKRESEMKKGLLELRNSVVLAFFMFNAIFVLLIFLLQLEKETIHINWPLGADVNITYAPASSQMYVNMEYLELEPIGLVFLAFFGLVLGTQFLGMVFHRFGTLSHILSATSINWCSKDTDKVKRQLKFIEASVREVKRLQKPKTESNKKASYKEPGRRKTIHNLARQQSERRQSIGNLEKQFHRNWQSISIADQPGRKKSTVVGKLQERRNTVVGRRQSLLLERRQSLGFDEGRNSITPSTSSMKDQTKGLYNKKQRTTSFKDKPMDHAIEMSEY